MRKYFLSTVLFLVFLCVFFSCKNNKNDTLPEDVKIVIQASDVITVNKNVLTLKKGAKWLDVKKEASEAITVKEKYIVQWHLENKDGELLEDSYEFKKDITIFALAKEDLVKLTIQASSNITIKNPYIEVIRGTKWKDVNASSSIDVPEKYVVQWKLNDENGNDLQDDYVFDVNTTIFALAKEDLVKITIKASNNITIKNPHIEVIRGTKWKDVNASSSIDVPEKYVVQWKLNDENGDNLEDDYSFDTDTTLFAKAKRDTVILTLRGDENVTKSQDLIVADRNEKWENIKEEAKNAVSVPENHTIEWHLDNAKGELLVDSHVFSKNAIIFAVTRKPFIDIIITGDSNVVVKKNKISIEKDSEWKDVRSSADEAITVAEGYTIQWKVNGTILLDSYKFLEATTIFAASSSKDLILVNPPTDWIVGKDVSYKIPSGFSKGVFIEGRKIKLSPYKISKTEMTYKFYKEVRDWAISHGYNLGEGKIGSKGTGSDSQPVTSVTWRDVIVWCNAYTEMKNGSEAECVYRKSETDSKVLKDINEKEGNKFVCDTSYFDKTKKGFRLPTEAEWEYAARYTENNENAEQYGAVFLTRLHSVSGAKKPVGFKDVEQEGASWDELKDELIKYAIVGKYWNGTAFVTTEIAGTEVVSSKTLNSLGLYDMSGNIAEWVFDGFNFGRFDKGEFVDPVTVAKSTSKVICGGSYSDSADKCCVGSRQSSSSNSKKSSVGFRIATYQ